MNSEEINSFVVPWLKKKKLYSHILLYFDFFFFFRLVKFCFIWWILKNGSQVVISTQMFCLQFLMGLFLPLLPENFQLLHKTHSANPASHLHEFAFVRFLPFHSTLYQLIPLPPCKRRKILSTPQGLHVVSSFSAFKPISLAVINNFKVSPILLTL